MRDIDTYIVTIIGKNQWHTRCRRTRVSAAARMDSRDRRKTRVLVSMAKVSAIAGRAARSASPARRKACRQTRMPSPNSKGSSPATASTARG